MMFGGLVLHRELEGQWYPPSIDTLMVREMHRNMAVPFALALGLMMLSGFFMWVVPKILQRRRPAGE